MSPFTLVIGPNGSGKTTALEAIRLLATTTAGWTPTFAECFRHPEAAMSIGAPDDAEIVVAGRLEEGEPLSDVVVRRSSKGEQSFDVHPSVQGAEVAELRSRLRHCPILRLSAADLAKPDIIQRQIAPSPTGGSLAVIWDALRDQHRERFEAIEAALQRWLPEFGQILFESPQNGKKAFLLRTMRGGHSVPAQHLSDGTLFALFFITLAHLPAPPSINCIEEPDHGIHPRLLREVHDALYRLAHPDEFGAARPAVQVVATTHSPHFLDLFRDHPEDVVVASKSPAAGTRFERLTEMPHFEDIIRDSTLGDAWYSGILGGVPARS